MHELGQAAMVVHTLELYTPAARHRDIYVLPRCPRPAPHLPRRLRHARQQTPGGLQLQRRQQVGLGHRFGQRHTQPIGAKRDTVTDIGDLAARVLL